MARRRITETAGQHAVREASALLASGEAVARPVLATAVRYLLEELALRHPGNSLEMRVPPFGAVQCIEGPKHTRGTPPNVVECDAPTWIGLATGSLTWEAAQTEHRVAASGTRADLENIVPLL